MERERNARRRKNAKKKKHAQRIYALVVLISGLAIIIMTVLLLFHIQKIEVKGNEYCSDREVAESIKGGRLSTNSLYLVLQYGMGKGNVLPCFESMQVSMKNPWTVQIRVKEKTIVAGMKEGEQYVYFDSEGLVVDKSAVKKIVPLVEGITLTSSGEYKVLECADTKLFSEVLDACRELQNYNLSVDKITCRNDRIYLRIANVKVNLGESISAEKIAQIPPIIEKLGGQEGTLHLENYADGQETITFEKAKKSK